MNRFLVAMLLSSLLWISPIRAQPFNTAVVQTPVADVRRSPFLPTAGESDDWQETQVLFGESVVVKESSGTWLFIEALEQPEFTHNNRWEGYPGWVQATSLSTATVSKPPTHVVSAKWASVYDRPGDTLLLRLPLSAKVCRLQERLGWMKIDLYNGRTGWVRSKQLHSLSGKWPPHRWRRQILVTALLFVGDPYVWGGLSPADPTGQMRLAGVDCSGLVHLSYRLNGVIVPRDSMEQHLRAEKIRRAQLQPADLIFSARADQPDKITHVSLYEGKDWLIEAPQTSQVVHRIRGREKFGKPIEEIESGDVVGKRVITFGRYLPQ
ncbi:MAG: NlpC/P60 family protein [Elusimicrobiota bacterium]|jgi:cell wall-associated NlpC family hydrolase